MPESDALKVRYERFAAIAEAAEDEETAQRKAEAVQRKLKSEQLRASHLASKEHADVSHGESRLSRKSGDSNQESGSQHTAYLEQYARTLSRSRSKKQDYQFPDTIEEQTAICEAADVLRIRGNALFKAGDVTEAAKLYEQAVLKFAGWYAECFATDEERKLVHAVKMPAHLNLAACSMKLGNLEHAVVHCTQVLAQEKHNTAAANGKAFFRRGSCHTMLGNLTDARYDLQRALSLSPSDVNIRKAMVQLQQREREYTEARRAMTRKMLGGAGGDQAEDVAADAWGESTHSDSNKGSDNEGTDGEPASDSHASSANHIDHSVETARNERLERLLVQLAEEDEEAAALARRAVEQHWTRKEVSSATAVATSGDQTNLSCITPKLAKWSSALAVACFTAAVSCVAAYTIGGRAPLAATGH